MTLALAASVLRTMLLGGCGWLWLRGQRELRLADRRCILHDAIGDASPKHR